MTQARFRDLLLALRDTHVVKAVGRDEPRPAAAATRLAFVVDDDGPGSPSSTNMAKVIDVLQQSTVSRASESDDRVVTRPVLHGEHPVTLVFSHAPPLPDAAGPSHVEIDGVVFECP